MYVVDKKKQNMCLFTTLCYVALAIEIFCADLHLDTKAPDEASSEEDDSEEENLPTAPNTVPRRA